MSGYRTVRVPVGEIDGATFLVCEDCGDLVYDRAVHDRHHQALKRAETNAQMAINRTSRHGLR